MIPDRERMFTRAHVTRTYIYMYIYNVQGTLRVGDEILAIDGSSLDGLTHAKALQMFKSARAGSLVLHVARRDPAHKRLCHANHAI